MLLEAQTQILISIPLHYHSSPFYWTIESFVSLFTVWDPLGLKLQSGTQQEWTTNSQQDEPD